MKSDSKIKPSHLNRNAYIYIRQSTEHQVRNNIESKQRQYELVDLAQQYQWHPESIVVIDDDLGRSASSTTGRTGFAKLVADVALSKAGAIWGLEVSRLARNNRDWYQLLDVSLQFETISTIIEQENGPIRKKKAQKAMAGFIGTVNEHNLQNKMAA